MIETFIQFITETNLIAALCVCFGFLIAVLGTLLPLVNYGLSYLWSIIDESEITNQTWFMETAKKYLNSKNPYENWEIQESGWCNYIIVSPCGNFKVGRKGSIVSYDTSVSDPFRSNRDAEEFLRLQRTKTHYWTFLLIGILLSAVAAVCFNYFLWATVYFLTAIGSIYGMRMLRRLQKAATKLTQAFKEHVKDTNAHANETTG